MRTRCHKKLIRGAGKRMDAGGVRSTVAEMNLFRMIIAVGEEKDVEHDDGRASVKMVR